MKLRSIAFLAVISMTALACGGANEEGSDDVDATNDELRTGTITEFTVNQSTGFIAPPPAGSCRAAGRWTVNLTTAAFDADACIAGKTVTVSRTLTPVELKSAKAGLAKIRTTARPTSCPTDVPVRSLQIKRGSTTTDYVEARSACGGSNAVTSASIGALIDVVTTLSEAGPEHGPQAETFEGTLQRVMAIGGETTGAVINTANESLELELTSAQRAFFVSGQRARVVGTRFEKHGVEIHTRHLIHVDDILVCPASGTTANCMAPTHSNVCLNSTWVSANCPGVSFLE